MSLAEILGAIISAVGSLIAGLKALDMFIIHIWKERKKNKDPNALERLKSETSINMQKALNAQDYKLAGALKIKLDKLNKVNNKK